MTASKAPSAGRKVERAFGPLGFPCSPDAKPAPLAPLAPLAPVPIEPAPERVDPLPPPAPVSAVAAPAPVIEPPPPRAASLVRQRIGHGSLAIFAGADALAELRDGGLRPERVRNLALGTGGPKSLALHGIERALFPWLLRNARAPLHVVGASLGSWRAALLASRDPASALERLCSDYIEHHFARPPSLRETRASGASLLSAALGREGVAPLISHPLLRLHIVTARTRLGLSFERVVFDAGGEPGPFAPWPGLRTTHVPLTAGNALRALQASAAMPEALEGFGAEIDAADGFTLYPCFHPRLAARWLDKALPWRRAGALRRTIVITPSAQHLASLPGGKLPELRDYATMSDRERIAAWRHVVALGHTMGSQLMELLESDRLRHVAQPLG